MKKPSPAAVIRSALRSADPKRGGSPPPAPPLADRYVPIPLDALPVRLRDLVAHGANAVGCDPANFALPGLAVLAAAVGNARAIELKPGWTEPAVLWAAVIGESSAKKSPGFRTAVAPLQDVQSGWIADYRAEVERAKAAGDDGRTPPRCRRAVAGDATVEAVAGILDANPRGLLVANQELDQWFSSFTRYSAGGKASDRARWLPLYDADPLIVDRKSSGTIEVRRAAVSVVGGIQPGVLARAFTPESRASGLSARFLLAAPPRPRQSWTDDAIPAAVLAEYRRLVEQLLAIPLVLDEHGRPPRLTLTAEAKAMFKGVTEVGGGPMAGAVALAEWFAAEAERIGAAAEATTPVRDATELRDTVERLGGTVTARDLQRANRSRFPTADAAAAELAKLEAAGWGRWVDSSAGGKGGRPTRRFVLTSPVVAGE